MDQYREECRYGLPPMQGEWYILRGGIQVTDDDRATFLTGVTEGTSAV